MKKLGKVEQADAQPGMRSSTHHRFLKKRKVRIERRRAKKNPETPHGYGRYSGWES